MKRYLVFMYKFWQPQGGWNAFRQDFDGLEAARTYVTANERDPDDHNRKLVSQIVDTTTGKLV